MSYFKYLDKDVFYTVEGDGKPVLILNGIMMSTKSWEPFMKTLAGHNKVIRLDFLDQGQSDKMTDSYSQMLQVDLIKALLEHLEVLKINIVGISYGGEVALQFAIKYPNLVERLLLFNTTAYTSPWLKDIGRGWIASGKTRNGKHYYQTTIPVIYSPHYYEKRLEWMKRREQVLLPIFSNPVFLDAMERLTLSAESFDVRDKLHMITAKTLIISAEEDYLTPVSNQEYLYKNILNSEWIKIPEAGHASMYEKPLIFTTLIIGFVNADLKYDI